MARITINGSHSTRSNNPTRCGAGLESVDASHSNYLLIQTHRPLRADEKTQPRVRPLAARAQS